MYRMQYIESIKKGKKKVKIAHLLAPLTILDSSAFTASEVAADWHWL